MKPNQTKDVIGIAIGAGLFLGSPMVAFALTAFGMMRAFDSLNGAGISDPHRLSGNISSVLYVSAGGVAGSLIGLVILIVSIVHLVNAGRRPSGSNETNYTA